VIRRVSLVRKRLELAREEFLARWTGRYPTGVLAKYARLVGSAASGARVGV